MSDGRRRLLPRPEIPAGADRPGTPDRVDVWRSPAEILKADTGRLLSSEPESRCDVLFVCAVPQEREWLLDAFEVSAAERRVLIQDYRKSHRFEYCSFRDGSVRCAVVTQYARGACMAAATTGPAVLALRPRLVAMAGSCAGEKRLVRAGDLVVASLTFDYATGIYTDRGLDPRPQQITLPADILSHVAGAVVGKTEIGAAVRKQWEKIYRQGPPEVSNQRPEVRLGPLGTPGLALSKGRRAEEILSVQGNLHGIDLEAHGIALASCMLNTKWIVCKGIEGFGAERKFEREVMQRAYSAFGSAALLRMILPEILALA